MTPERLLRVMLTRTPLGWRQLTHKRGRMFVAIAGVAFANLLVFMQLGFMGALFESTVQTHRSLKADIVITSSISRQLVSAGTIPRARVMQALAVEGVAEATPLYIGQIEWINPITKKKGVFQVFGVDPDADAFRNPEISDQLWKLKLPNALLFDRLARGEWAEFISRAGNGESVPIEASGREATIEGLFSMGAAFATDGIIVTSETTWLRFAPARPAGVVSLALLRVEPGRDPSEVAARLAAWLPASDTRVMTYDEFILSEKAFLRKDSPIAFIFSFGVAMGMIVGAAIVYQVLSSDVNDHLAEYATLKAIGFSQNYLLGVVFEEALILAALGFLPSLAVSFGLYAATHAATALPISMPWDRPPFVFALTFCMCCASGALATRNLAHADPADVF